MTKKYITLYPEYFLLEGFGALMSHYSVLYALHKDTGVTPMIINIDFQSQNRISAMEYHNKNINESIIYHHEVFDNLKNIFSIVNEADIVDYKWIFKNFINLPYNELIKEIQLENNNMICLWSLNSELTNRYLDDIINYLFVFNNNISHISRNNLPKTNKEIVGISVRTEYKKLNGPHTQLSMNFYQKAMEQFDKNNTQYLIFGDDIEECRSMFYSLEDIYNITYTKAMPSAIGLCTLSLCDHIVCANSSFSYWSAVLNKNPNKKIICSSKFIDETKDTSLALLLNYKWYPKDWVALDIV